MKPFVPVGLAPPHDRRRRQSDKGHQRDGIENQELFRQIISQAFVQKRKTIYNNLKSVRLGNSTEIDWLKVLNAADIEPARRAESLRMAEWEKLIFNLENGSFKVLHSE